MIRIIKNITLAVLLLTTGVSQAKVHGRHHTTSKCKHYNHVSVHRNSHRLSGVASWYGPGFHGRKTSSGERFNQHSFTAAHRTLPFGTLVEVTNLNNGRIEIGRAHV